MARKMLIHNVTIVTAGRAPFAGRVLIDGTLIAAVEERTDAGDVDDGVTTVDGRGALLLPGAIDEHVHFREPGMTSKATIASESRAAVAGGVTSFIDMPNVVPPTVSVERLNQKLEIAARDSRANYGFYIGATADNLSQLPSLDYSRIAGVKLFIGATTGSLVLDNDEDLERLFATVPALIAVHAEDNATIDAARRALLEAHGGGEDLPVECHPQVRSREACLRASRRAVDLARRHGSRLHLMHISTADELELLTPGDLASKRITAETCPQYLLFDSSDYTRRGTRVKCNPAIKDAADRRSLVDAVKSGLIDTIATDHAPHLPADKQGGALKAASGMPMVQFSMPLMLDLLGAETVAERMAAAPAKLLGIDRRGEIRPGWFADIALIEKTAPREITDSEVVSTCGWTPAAGLSTSHRVVLTLVNGAIAFSLRDDVAIEPPAAMPLSFNHSEKS